MLLKKYGWVLINVCVHVRYGTQLRKNDLNFSKDLYLPIAKRVKDEFNEILYAYIYMLMRKQLIFGTDLDILKIESNLFFHILHYRYMN